MIGEKGFAVCVGGSTLTARAFGSKDDDDVWVVGRDCDLGGVFGRVEDDFAMDVDGVDLDRDL